MKTILFVNSCVLRETSRTQRLADAYLERLKSAYEAAGESAEIIPVVLEDLALSPLNGGLLEERREAITVQDWNHPLCCNALQFSQADEIVFAAPYWDLNFPAMLKIYMEHLCVNGLTFTYSPEGIPQGLCRASRITYITTVGGYVMDWNLGFEYIADVCRLYFGINQAECIKAEGLDIVGNDAEAILATAINQLEVIR